MHASGFGAGDSSRQPAPTPMYAAHLPFINRLGSLPCLRKSDPFTSLLSIALTLMVFANNEIQYSKYN
jgi:hypothetical protein